jgi:hypothetical protein
MSGVIASATQALKHPVTVTIANDTITIVQANMIVFAETGITDNLATINGGELITGIANYGHEIYIKAQTGQTITIKHAIGNIMLTGGADFTLSGNKVLPLRWFGTSWVDVSTSATGGGGGGGMTSFSVASDSGTSQTITDGNTLSIVTGAGLSGVASATDTITLSLDVPVSNGLGGTGADLSATGGTGQIVKQSTLGGSFSVGALVASELPTVPINKGGTALTTTPTNGQLLVGNGTGYTLATLTAGSGVNITNGVGSITVSSTAGSAINNIVGGRLTVSSGQPAPAQGSSTTLYYTPYVGNNIALYNGTSWEIKTFSEISLALSTSANTNYDVFIFDNAGTLTLETVAWTNDTTRAVALVAQDGVLSKTGELTKRYLGSMRGSVANTVNDLFANRLLINYYNTVQRHVSNVVTTDSWTYAVANTWRSFNAVATSFDTIYPVLGQMVYAHVTGWVLGAINQTNAVGIGINSTTTNSATMTRAYRTGATATTTSGSMDAIYLGQPNLGYNVFNAIEAQTSTGSATYFADNGTALNIRVGIVGYVAG